MLVQTGIQVSKTADDLGFETGGAGASATFMMHCSALHKNGFVVVKGRPRKVVEMATSKTGSRATTRSIWLVLTFLLGRSMKIFLPVPNIKRNDFQLTNI